MMSELERLFNKKQNSSEAMLIDILIKMYEGQKQKNVYNQSIISEINSENNELKLAFNSLNKKVT